ncbi:hypothetical protein MMAG44476_37508 [Mycolicibacterium mageritense DSM 44476 = CIP 104973]|jgi:hypothetical protein|uniref:Uncharacterized protein n=2 Tax=Mycolicibacterium TaxID=1866885 RepID=A0A100W803_MYCCR|nr:MULTISPECIES: hypothetical protein [Mycolicibacterium]MCC9185486.1 hypothetical protein [Mycolicibacterium mageritense]MCV7210757.1 hypothetical protein [Mycolicibacterium canariasense]ORV18597.1 hypothetical protein AWB94_33170 [Mycolicibacterium canariasense]CDO25745.1 hypothetical protein BN978_06260 [Mycolicibacterium mageritense DSM 44476 = CIP 104973]BBX37590.1 hypothetical protein MMAGJ_68720 [Mycolicibacterium mageritense]
MRLRVKAGILLVAAAAVAGCTGVPDRGSEALDIEQRISAMPGVSDVDLVYDNGILEGTRFELRIDMAQATDEQIGAVAAEINTARGDRFEEFDQRIEIDIADFVTLGASASLPDDSADVATRLRDLDGRVAAQTIDMLRTSAGATRITINGAEETATVVDTVLQVFANRPFDQVEVNPPAGPGTQASWWIRTQLGPEQKHHIDMQLAAAAPATPRLLIIRDGEVERLNVAIPSPETAHADIVRVIAALGAGSQHPLELGWSWADDPARHGDLRWSGGVDIGNCADPDANTGSDPDLVPAARQFQQRIRDEYGPCVK